ncbi:hypothetical protein [Mycobacterium spongiae]|uniref:hypothetical protein n=1 Tax=Mycobacterium spongiae TaxID=886343 RepID=UPI003CCE9B3C
MPTARLGDLQVPAHLVELLAGCEELVDPGELADDLIRRVPPALVRCHVVADSSCPNTPGNRVAQRLDHYSGLTSSDQNQSQMNTVVVIDPSLLI